MSESNLSIDGSKDFDFIIGDWIVQHRRLKSRLEGSTQWLDFSGTSSTRKILSGFGNVEDNVLDFPEGRVEAAAIRSFDSKTQTWAIWWLDRRLPHSLDVPVLGRFSGVSGTFVADDVLNGRPIKIRFIWNKNPGGDPTWEQAFSDDEGQTWETNWTMVFTRV